jgi:hypothetical protein
MFGKYQRRGCATTHLVAPLNVKQLAGGELYIIATREWDSLLRLGAEVGFVAACKLANDKRRGVYDN